MVAVDMDLLELILRYAVLPVIIGLFVVSGLTAYDSRVTIRIKDRENRRGQLDGARKTMDQVMKEAERISSLMRYHAWAIAWRKRRPKGTFGEDLIEDDEKKWRLFDDALTEWRSKRIQYRRAIEIYFGQRATASKLFKLVDATIDKLSFELWFIYHNNPSNPNIFLQTFVEDIGQPYDTIFNAIMTSIDEQRTQEQEETVHRTVANAFDELQDKVSRLCFEMSECIRNENVGSLRTDTNRSSPTFPAFKRRLPRDQQTNDSDGTTNNG